MITLQLLAAVNRVRIVDFLLWQQPFVAHVCESLSSFTLSVCCICHCEKLRLEYCFNLVRL